MNGKKIIFFAAMALIAVNVYAQSMTLDEAIRTTASELGQKINADKLLNVSSSSQSIEEIATDLRQQLTAQIKIAVLNFSSDWQELSNYVIDELYSTIVRDGSLTVVERDQLNLARQELNFQMSGDVDDKSAQSIGKFLVAQSVLSGSFTVIGNAYRFRIRVIAVETGVVQYSNAIDIKKDNLLTALMPKKPKELPPPKPPRDLPEFGPRINWCLGDLGGGNIVGFEFQMGFQAGIAVGALNFLLDADGGIGTRDGGAYAGLIYHLGGLIEYKFVDIFVLGAGGGIGGFSDLSEVVGADESIGVYYYPYIRAAASIMLDILLPTKLGLYYDYNFDYGSKIGLRFIWEFGSS